MSIEPEKFKQGDLISSERLNEMIDYSHGPYSSVPGNSDQIFGSRYAGGSGRRPKAEIRLLYATQDFTYRTTDAGTTDDVPSGLCEEVSLNRGSNSYEFDTGSRPYYVHDPISEFNLDSSITDGQVFAAYWNSDSKRWEVLKSGASGSQTIRHALVCRCIGKGWYVLELMDGLQLQPPEEYPYCDEITSDSDSGSASGSEENISCDLCDLPTNDGDLACPAINYYEECGIPEAFDPLRPRREESCEQVLTGNGTYVFAYDKRAVPLKENGQVTIAWLGDTIDLSLSASGSASESANNQERLWVVLNGEYEMVTIPHEDWECCDDVIKRVSCVTFIVEGVMCAGPEDPCESV